MRTLVAALLFAGCHGDARPRYVTEHLRITVYDEAALCRGTRNRLEDQVVRVADFLDVPIPHDFDVEYGPSAVDEICRGMPSGCASGVPEGTRIAADESSVMHELVHGVRSVNGVLGARLFEEGLAEVLGGVSPTPYVVNLDPASVDPGPVVLSTLKGSAFEYEHYPTAAHFVSWMLVDLDEEGTRAFLNSPQYAGGDILGFEANLGVSLAGAEMLWRTSSEMRYEWGTVCEPGREIAWVGSEATLVGSLDCDESHTIGPIGGRMSSPCSAVTTPAADLEVEFDAVGGEAVIARAEECEPGGDVTPEHYQDKSISAGERTVLPFAACRWRVYVRADGLESMDYSLAIRLAG
jgi:hypothetical protein